MCAPSLFTKLHTEAKFFMIFVVQRGQKDGFILDNTSAAYFIDFNWLRNVFFQLPNGDIKIQSERVRFYYISELEKLAELGMFNHPIARRMIEAFVAVVVFVFVSDPTLNIPATIKQKTEMLIASVGEKRDVKELASSCWGVLCHDIDAASLAELLNWQPAHLQIAAKPFQIG